MSTVQSLTTASEWLVRLQSEKVSPAEVSAWLDWCNASAENMEAFERAQALYERLRTVDDAARSRLLELGGNAAPVRNQARRRYVWPAALAASLAAAAGLFFWQSSGFRGGDEHSEYRAAHGAQRELVLADRSRVTLGSASTVVSSFSPTARYIDLNGGEAYFRVHPDRTRPFVVRAGKVSVTAIGTAFNVRRTDERTVISVTEGSVDVAPLGEQGRKGAGKGPVAPLRLQAGQQAIYSKIFQDLMTVVTAVEPNVATGWMSGRREYMFEPLGSVIDDVNRYAHRPITLSDPALRELVFTGTVFQHQVDEWVLALDEIFPVRAQVQTDGRVVLEARNKNFR